MNERNHAKRVGFATNHSLQTLLQQGHCLLPLPQLDGSADCVRTAIRRSCNPAAVLPFLVKLWPSWDPVGQVRLPTSPLPALSSSPLPCPVRYLLARRLCIPHTQSIEDVAVPGAICIAIPAAAVVRTLKLGQTTRSTIFYTHSFIP